MVAARMAFVGLVLYMTLDFANPLMAGAVCFDPAESVEGIGRARVSVDAPSVTVSPVAEPVSRVDPAPRLPAWHAAPGAPPPIHIAPRVRTAPAFASSPSPDDH